MKYDARLKDANQNRVDDVEQAVARREPLVALERRARAAPLDMATTRAHPAGVRHRGPGPPDCPIVFAWTGFWTSPGRARRFSGATAGSCRVPTDARACAVCEAVDQGDECTVRLLNYTKQGKPFWNMFTLAPVRDETGRIHDSAAGIQVDVAERHKDVKARPAGEQ